LAGTQAEPQQTHSCWLQESNNNTQLLYWPSKATATWTLTTQVPKTSGIQLSTRRRACCAADRWCSASSGRESPLSDDECIDMVVNGVIEAIRASQLVGLLQEVGWLLVLVWFQSCALGGLW